MNISNETVIRELVMSGCSDMIRELLLIDDHLELVQEIKLNGIYTASILAEDKDISIQNASSRLKNLYLKGYLKRDSKPSESGGIEFIYYYGAGI